jgi:hypothetical protein
VRRKGTAGSRSASVRMARWLASDAATFSPRAMTVTLSMPSRTSTSTSGGGQPGSSSMPTRATARRVLRDDERLPAGTRLPGCASTYAAPAMRAGSSTSARRATDPTSRHGSSRASGRRWRSACSHEPPRPAGISARRSTTARSRPDAPTSTSSSRRSPSTATAGVMHARLGSRRSPQPLRSPRGRPGGDGRPHCLGRRPGSDRTRPGSTRLTPASSRRDGEHLACVGCGHAAVDV